MIRVAACFSDGLKASPPRWFALPVSQLWSAQQRTIGLLDPRKQQSMRMTLTSISRLANLLRTIGSMLLVLLITTGHSTAARIERMQAPASRISLELPDDFKPSPLFSGFIDLFSSTAVMIHQLPADEYDRVSASFAAANLAEKGITNVTKLELKRSDKYTFIIGEQKYPTITFEKFILAIKDDKNTAVITFNVPVDAYKEGSLKREAVIRALTSAKLEASVAPGKDFFKLDYTGPFELADRPSGTSRIYYEKGDTNSEATRNLIVIGPSLNRLPIRNINEFSEYAINSLKSVKGLQVNSARDLRVHGMAGHQITGTGMRGAKQIAVTIRQLILLPAEGGYYRLLSVTRTADDARLAPEIEKIFASFKTADELIAK